MRTFEPLTPADRAKRVRSLEDRIAHFSRLATPGDTIARRSIKSMRAELAFHKGSK